MNENTRQERTDILSIAVAVCLCLAIVLLAIKGLLLI